MKEKKMSSALKHELAGHIYQYLCHEAQYSDLPEAAKESLTAASECIEQAYKLNVNNPLSSAASSNTNNPNTQSNSNTNNLTTNHHKPSADNVGGSKSNPNSVVLPDELLRIFTRHKEYLLSQQIESQERGNSSSSQHPISQLPMTTRKKLSHLRAQIKRQASKAARSRLEKRSSVSGTGTTNNNDRAGSSSGHHFGISLDATSTKQHYASDGYDTTQHHHHHEEIHHQPNSTSSTESPTAIAFSSNPTTSSPAGAMGNQPGSNLISSSGGNQQETSSNLSPGQQQNESGASSSGGGQSGAAGGKHGSNSGHLAVPRSGHHRHKEFGVSVHQKNFKQKLIALLKKFRTDGSGFDSEEQYREALERELMKAAAGRGSRAIEELLEEDIDVEEESGSELEDWDNISESSTPKPSLRPFFSSTTLDKI